MTYCQSKRENEETAATSKSIPSMIEQKAKIFKLYFLSLERKQGIWEEFVEVGCCVLMSGVRVHTVYRQSHRRFGGERKEGERER